MKKATESFTAVAWKAIEHGVEDCQKKYSNLIFHADKFEEFNKLFNSKYQDIMNRFMVNGTVALDSHKQAAILTICCLELNIIEHNLDNSDEFSILPQFVAINVALTYMKDCLNDLLKKKKIAKRIEQYYLPIAIACETSYESTSA